MDDLQARERVARIEALLGEVEDVPAALEVVQALLDLYGEGLGRIVARVPAEELTGDELVSHLLLLHDLHPVPVEVRVRGALEAVRPYLETHGGNVELLGVRDGVARVRMEGSCSGCPSSAMTLKLAIEEAVHKAAPDVERVEAEDGPPAPQLLQIDDLTCPLPMAAP
jgi:Fe-S cluster biogenesis protein NfuA